ncbi:hypothetical protein NLJ89_g3252 [Agrocybe chaxingu]|uniref:Uncharacterized protein n=1 Tax=Agrocybe chaxingu TaxID=84603 RepID=A0A9W8K500_9AGAR|nr:hypothetical protein NLJ89_g3252 [Agrocybe chaxingu]
MKFTNTLLAVVSVVAVSFQSVNAFDWGTMCSDANFVGSCTTYQADPNQCVSFTGSNAVWNDVVSSISVVGGAQCMFSVNAGCSGTTDTFTAGRHNTVPHNDQYSSFRCIFVA